MADQQHLDILKHGVDVWNKWREEQTDILPDLSGADLSRSDLIGFDLTGANLTGANLTDTNFYGAKLASVGKVFKGSLVLLTVDLVNADLTRAGLGFVDLSGANLAGANLTGANLGRSILLEANLNTADLTNAFLYYTNFNEAKLDEANFNNARMAKTVFGNVDLSKARGLETVRHEAPLVIGIDTIYRSKGNIPEIFLHGAGVPDSFISYLHLLVGHPIDYYSCFISYSSKDQAFAERLYADLQGKGVRCWFAPENIRVGDKIRSSIDESIRLYDKLLLIISQHSLASQWVQREVEIALKKEREEKQTFLFPIRLDDSIMTATASWATSIRSTKHIADFRQWSDHDEYQKALSRLIRDLKITVATESNMRGSGDEE